MDLAVTKLSYQPYDLSKKKKNHMIYSKWERESVKAFNTLF